MHHKIQLFMWVLGFQLVSTLTQLAHLAPAKPFLGILTFSHSMQIPSQQIALVSV